MQVNEKWRNSTTAPLKTPESTVTIICPCDYVEDPYPEQNFITIRLYHFAPSKYPKICIKVTRLVFGASVILQPSPQHRFLRPVDLPQIMREDVPFVVSKTKFYISKPVKFWGKIDWTEKFRLKKVLTMGMLTCKLYT